MEARVSSQRELAFDIFKGLSILEVITHHVLGFSDKRFAAPGTAEYWALVVLQKSLHFAVPAFLMASAILLARSLVRLEQPDWKRFYLRRALRTLWPYILWTAVYLTVDARLNGNPFNAAELPVDIAWGKAYYHFYFFSVLLQMSIAFPILLWIVRRPSLGFGGWAAVALVAQSAVFLLNYWYSVAFQSASGFLPFPAASLLWYVPPILLGVWLGANWDQWERTWRTYRVPFFLCAGGGLAGYLALELRILEGGEVNSRIYNLLYTLYATGCALLLLQFSIFLSSRRNLGGVIAAIGNRSLSLFVLHPLVLDFQGKPPIGRIFQYLPVPYFWAWLITFGASWLIVESLYRLRVGPLLFGR